MINLNEISGQAKAAQAKKEHPKNINELDNKAFMRLFLEQLKNQDPTAPMETDKIITQTAQLTQVEMQEQQKKTMVEVAEAMKSTKTTNEELKNFQESMKKSLEDLSKSLNTQISSNEAMAQIASLNAINLIGKIAQTDVSGLNIGEDDSEISFDLFFQEPINAKAGQPVVEILNSKNELVASLPITTSTDKSAYLNFKWDTRNTNGERVENGNYSVRARYNMDENGHYEMANLGRGEIQGVLFDNGKAMIRMGEMILPISSAIAFFDKGTKLPPISSTTISKNKEPKPDKIAALAQTSNENAVPKTNDNLEENLKNDKVTSPNISNAKNDTIQAF